MIFHGLFAQSEMDREEAKAMFIYLQELRQGKAGKNDPVQKYAKKNSPMLHWNDTLAAVAEQRAMDLAKNNYFDHVDKKGRGVNYYIAKAGYALEKEWQDRPSNNFFESLQAGKTGHKEVIQDLIIDKGIPSKGHRKHLLGLDDWNEKNVDVGIAHYIPDASMKTDYQSYTVIIIARHHW